ncbi:MAG TPA: NAD(P)H-dependent oxidoreductase [Chryseolinea sp.]
MKKVLVINSSARTRISLSRKLTEVFVDHWKSIHTHPIIRFRELGNTDVPHVNEKWIAAAFKPEAARSDDEIEALKISDAYISELREADVIVVGSPMYNWSIPSTLKAYLDQVLRVNETFKIDPTRVQNPYVGLLKNKTLFLLLSRGEQGYEKGGYNEHMDFQSTYLKTVFTIMGISNIHVITLSGKSPDAEQLKKSIDTSHQSIRDLMETELANTVHP